MGTKKKNLARKSRGARKAKPRERRQRDGMHRTTLELPKEQWQWLEERAERLSDERGTQVTTIAALRELLTAQMRQDEAA